MKDFLQFAKDRYSVRKYKDTPIEEEKLARILEAAKLAPTACNNQPQKIFVVKSDKMRKALAEVTPCTFSAPVVFVVGYHISRSAKGLISRDFDFGTIDAAIACTHMMLEATDLALGSCWVGNFSERRVKEALGIDEDICIRALLPVGYAADDAVPYYLHDKSRDISELVVEL